MKLEEKVRSGDEHPALESHLAKYRSLVPSLALLIHLADGGQGPVNEKAILKAIRWTAYLESHARRIYSIVTNPAVIAGKALAKRIQKGELKDGFTLREVYRKHWTGLCEKEAVKQAVDLLLELGWLREEVEETPGKPKIHYCSNPALLPKTAKDPSAKSDKNRPDPPFGTFGTDHPRHSDGECRESGVVSDVSDGRTDASATLPELDGKPGGASPKGEASDTDASSDGPYRQRY